jgi:hypothetical protein
LKFLLVANLQKQILFLSYAYYGFIHDYTIMKSEFDPCLGYWFDEHHLYVDLGFLGIRKDYCEKANIPCKRSKKHDLTPEQKQHNQHVSKIRIKVEHSIGGMKRYRVLSDRLRMKSVIRYNQIAGICAGIWNFQLTG